MTLPFRRVREEKPKFPDPLPTGRGAPAAWKAADVRFADLTQAGRTFVAPPRFADPLHNGTGAARAIKTVHLRFPDPAPARSGVPAEPGPVASTPDRPGIAEDPSLYLNSELSLLQFQRRVLEEACDSRNPLLERVKFLAILNSNLDEFFMVRIAGLLQQIESGVEALSIDGQSPGAQMRSIRRESTRLMGEMYASYRGALLPELNAAGVEIAAYSSLTVRQREEVQAWFLENVYPVLTPLAFDRERPFPHISNLSLNLAVVVRDAAGAERFARVKVPDTINQLVPVPQVSLQKKHAAGFVWIEEVILANLDLLFPGLEIVEAHPFHVTRDAEMPIKEIETDDLLAAIQEAVWQRRFRDVVRLVVNSKMPAPLLEILTTNLEIEPCAVYRVDGPLNLSRLRQLTGLARPDLKDRPFLPQRDQSS